MEGMCYAPSRMAGKRSLPLVVDPRGPAADRPTLEKARRRLGGRASTDGSAGQTVRFLGEDVTGVILFGSDEQCDVLLESGTVRRTKPELVAGAPPEERFLRLMAEVRLFGRLREGERVRFEQDGHAEAGLLVEKCRYGALVAKDDGKILAVGFRRIWPVENPES
jgi:hypothetical protein